MLQRSVTDIRRLLSGRRESVGRRGSGEAGKANHYSSPARTAQPAQAALCSLLTPRFPASPLPRPPLPHPLDRPVRVVLPLPDRHPSLQLFDHVAAGDECVVAVGRGGHNRQRRRPRSSARRSDAAAPRRPASGIRFPRRCARTRLRPWGIGDVVEPEHLTPFWWFAYRPEKTRHPSPLRPCGPGRAAH